MKISDTAIERMISIVLRTGVLIAAATVLCGGIYYLLGHGDEAANFHQFHGQPNVNRIVSQIIRGALALRAQSVIQFGVLLLIATPIARVVVALAGFALERDRTYVVITSIVLTVLLFSLIAGTVYG